ncbi:MAG: hypothetical protein ACI976_001583 [Aureispira sp.]
MTLIKKIILPDAAAAGAYMQNIEPLGTNKTNTIAAAAFAAANFMITAY